VRENESWRMWTPSVKRERQSGGVCSEAKINSAGLCNKNGTCACVVRNTTMMDTRPMNKTCTSCNRDEDDDQTRTIEEKRMKHRHAHAQRGGMNRDDVNMNGVGQGGMI